MEDTALKQSFWWTLAGGVLIGYRGLDLLASKAAKKGYGYIVAGAMLARDRILADAEKVQAAASDIAADAKEITLRYYDRCEREAMDFEETAC